MKARGGQSRPRRPMQQNLRRARKAMKRMVQVTTEEAKEDGMAGGDRRFKRQRGQLPRKQRRKEERRLKKAKKHAFLSRKFDELEQVSKKQKSSKKGELEAKPKTKSVTESNTAEKKRRREEKLLKEKEEQRRRELLAANEDEEKSIRRLEKELRFRKKKKTKEKITPTAFRDDGLDYLLDIVDPAKLEEAEEEMEGFMSFGKDSDGEDDTGATSDDGNEDEEDETFEEDDDSDDGVSRSTKRSREEGSGRRERREKSKFVGGDDDSDSEGFDDGSDESEEREHRTKKRRTSFPQRVDKKSLESDELSENDSSGGLSDENSAEFDSNNTDGDDDDDDVDAEEEKKPPLPKMDPYGNIVGEKPVERTGAYIPPHKRAEMMGQSLDAEKQAKLDKLRKQLKGAINRLSESNAQSICNQIEELYLSNSRNDMNETLCALVQDACISPALTPERLAMEHVLLVAVLHSNVGSEVGAHLLQSVAKRFDDLHGDDCDYGNGKEIDNIVMLIVHLFNFRLVHCTLIYDLIRRLAERFTERDIELLLQILKCAGTTLRKDDPASLKDIILLIQGKASQCSDELRQQSRVKFMLETISALRNNNLRKIPNYDPSDMERLRKLHRHLIKERGHSDTDSTLRISLADLLKADERGRWWIVGSAWSGHGPKQEPSALSGVEMLPTVSSVNDETSKKIVELSRQQRMNTDIRRTIFSIIMTAEDFKDAFEKLVRLGQKGGRDREVVHITLDCCQQEKSYNPYYAFLASSLCQYDRKFRMAFQFALWDKIRLLEELTPSGSRNLALLLSHLLGSRDLPLSVLKVIEFADISKHTVRFLRTLLLDLLLEKPEATLAAVFGAVAAVTKLRILREGLGLFMHHFLLKMGQKQIQLLLQRRGDGAEELLRKRVLLAESAMQGEDGPVKL
ncbi:nucleolar MIF4G domain-containing protein 1-like [Diadema antillarum]|uniref:nucleolar MIF4G domain-containing protein 1-like n=1 Tax=Diadema antillarum TaxID=105358 RepID=UPI003A85ACF1